MNKTVTLTLHTGILILSTAHSELTHTEHQKQQLIDRLKELETKESSQAAVDRNKIKQNIEALDLQIRDLKDLIQQLT